uniref:Secreted protein n=2 Tax=Picea TaxID=3328 RepID=A0A117NHX1_PICGL|nr:hypothetical protein ABT39_MTgene4364 [Picea glauca]QHR91796.1 hypothetical protein Q903MT_gene5832 [Picea sitchensis]
MVSMAFTCCFSGLCSALSPSSPGSVFLYSSLYFTNRWLIGRVQMDGRQNLSFPADSIFI